MLPARTLAAVCLFAPVVFAQLPPTTADPPNLADPKPVPVKPPMGGLILATDSTWKANPNPPDGWEKAEYDDTKWDAVSVNAGPTGNGQHYTLANQCGVPTAAEWVWLGGNASLGIRRTFDAPAEVKRAELLLIADDEAEVSLNGVPVAVYSSSNNGWGHRGGAALVDLSPHILPGKKNVLTARVKDLGAPNGFAAEVRVNAAPVLPRLLLGEPKPPGQDVIDELDVLTKRLGDPLFAVRDKASRRLLELTREHGQGLYAKLNALVAKAEPEAARRLEDALDRLDGERAAVFAPEGTDGRFFYPPMPLQELKRWWDFAPLGNPTAVRFRVQAKALRNADTKGFDVAARDLATDGNDTQAANVVAFVADLEIAELADVLTTVLEKRPKTLAAALAASGLGRLGKDRVTDSQRKLLTAAAKCGHEPTERAANVALAALK